MRLYHYCGLGLAQALVAEDAPWFQVEREGRFGSGMYATDIEPESLDTTQIVNSDCFNGESCELNLKYVLVLDDPNDLFIQESETEWRWPSELLAILGLDYVLVEILELTDDGFRTFKSWDQDRCEWK